MAVRERTAPRAVDVSEEAPSELSAHERAAREFVAKNAEANKLTAQAKKLKSKLEEAMSKGKVKVFAFMFDGATYDAQIAPSEVEYIDPVALAKEIGADKVLEICSVTQGAVKDAFGSAMAEKCKAKQTKPEALSVKKRK